MAKTIKQIADELGVSKQAVHQKRKSKALAAALQPFTTTVDGVVYISVDGENLLKQAFLASGRKDVADNQTETDRQPNEDVLAVLKATIDTLQGQLAVKDAQIAGLTAALENTTASLQAAQALHAGTMHQQLLPEADAEGTTTVAAAQEPSEQKQKKWHWPWRKKGRGAGEHGAEN